MTALQRALRLHWPEYLMEAAGLGLFMVSAGLFGALLESPDSPVRQTLPDPFVRRALMGAAMGLTAVGLIYYPWGRQSGAHYNPAVTWTFWRLGRINSVDAMFYTLAQLIGGVCGVLAVTLAAGAQFTSPPVNSVCTLPGSGGVAIAFLGEAAISFLLMLVVLVCVGSPRIMRFTGVFAGILVAAFITFEAPLSGMSMNPARTFASALPANMWTAWWVYLTAPFIGMLAAAEFHRVVTGRMRASCAKLFHCRMRRCIFCGYEPQPADRLHACNLTAPAASQ